MAMTKTIQATVKNRTDTAANWTQKNPVLAEGEIIVVQTSAGETRLKIGDGVKTFTQLPYTDEQIYNNVVTSVNGQTGDVTLDVSGVQPDWNQNDSTAADYIKNRPFYSETENVTVENAVEVELNRFPVFEVGDTVTVNVDGVEHSLVAFDDEGSPTIGDMSSSIGTAEGQFGWLIYFDGSKVWFSATEAHTVSYFGEEVVKIDPKYLPNPNALTFTGAVIGSYDGSAPISVNIPTVPTKTSQLTNDSGFLTSHQDISGKQDKATLEADVAEKGFTKNTGTYSKPAGGIPKSDLDAAVQTSLGKADSALQEHQSLAAYRTAAAQDVIDSGKVDKVGGKGLSTNDYTAADKAKVDAIPANPKYTDTVYDDTALKERIATIEGKESAWDAKSDFSGSYNDLTDKPTPLIGTTGTLTPTQVHDAMSEGIPVKVQYFDDTFGWLSYTNFNIAENMNMIVANSISIYYNTYILSELYGDTTNNTWGFTTTTLAEKANIPETLPNPNAITFTGAVTGTYDGSEAVTINIPESGAGNMKKLTFTGAVTGEYDGTTDVNVDIPIATTSTAGTIKVGNGLSVSADGTLSVTTATYYTGTADPVNTLGADGDLYLKTEG